MSRFALAFVAVFAAPAPALAEAAYFSAIEDLPLPPGFTEGPSAGEGFGSESGRIVLMTAEGALTPLAVRDFYYDTLPQLGWSVSPQTDGTLVFQRGREQLSFTVETANGRTRLGARLVVAAAPSNGD
jgi:hypothetical protein